MANTNTPATEIRRLLAARKESIASLSRRTGIAYKPLLAELKHETRPLALETATRCAVALDVTLPDLIDEAAA